MSRARALILIVVLVLFGAVGASLVATNSNQGGPKAITFNLAVTGGNKMSVTGTSSSPFNLQAHQNDTITFNVRSDREGEVHLHGYDMPMDVKPGQTTTVTVKAMATCTCEIEWEATGTHLGTLIVSP